jgi:hypothetical protein
MTKNKLGASPFGFRHLFVILVSSFGLSLEKVDPAPGRGHPVPGDESGDENGFDHARDRLLRQRYGLDRQSEKHREFPCFSAEILKWRR